MSPMAIMMEADSPSIKNTMMETKDEEQAPLHPEKEEREVASPPWKEEEDVETSKPALTPEKDESNGAESKHQPLGQTIEKEDDDGSNQSESQENKKKAEPTEKELAQQAARRANWPIRNIQEPSINDCLFGRGGGTNHHPGNKRYRQMVDDRKAKYLSSKRLDKPLVALDIIREWRAQDPPGRFLKQDEGTKLWEDVGDKKAREKTSQALREKASALKGQQEEGDGFDGVEKETRFEQGSPPVRKSLPRSRLERDHSLGTEFVDGKEFSMEGFSWDEMDEPLVKNMEAVGSPVASNSLHYHHGRHPSSHHDPSVPPLHPYVREHSLSNNPLTDASVSQQGNNPFGDPYYSHRPPHSSHPSRGPHPPHGHPPPPSTPVSSQGHHHSSPHPSQPTRQREHSLQSNPLRGASTRQPAHNTFTDDGMSWGRSDSYDSRGQPVPPPPHYAYPPPPNYWGSPPPPPQYGAPPIVRPSPQRYLGNTPSRSAFARTESEARSNSILSLGSNSDGGPSVDPNGDRQKSRSSFGSSVDFNIYDSRGDGRVSNRASIGSIHFDSQDFSKIADLMSADGCGDGRERSNSWGGYSRKESRDGSVASVFHTQPLDYHDSDGHGIDHGGNYEDTIQRSKSMPYPGLAGGSTSENTAFPSPPRNIQTRKKPMAVEKGAEMDEAVSDEEYRANLPSNNVMRPSLLRKLSGGGVHRNNSIATAPDGVRRPEPIKRDTSNQPESLETKRSIKRAVLSRDHSAVATRLKEQQKLKWEVSVEDSDHDELNDGKAKVSSRLSKAELLDRKLSVEINKLGLSDNHISLDRMCTEDVLASLIDDNDLEESLMDDNDLEYALAPLKSTPKPLSANDRVTTIDAIAMDIANGRSQPFEVDDALSLIMENGPVAEPTLDTVNEDIAEKWLRGERTSV